MVDVETSALLLVDAARALLRDASFVASGDPEVDVERIRVKFNWLEGADWLLREVGLDPQTFVGSADVPGP